MGVVAGEVVHARGIISLWGMKILVGMVCFYRTRSRRIGIRRLVREMRFKPLGAGNRFNTCFPQPMIYSAHPLHGNHDGPKKITTTFPDSSLIDLVSMCGKDYTDGFAIPIADCDPNIASILDAIQHTDSYALALRDGYCLSLSYTHTFSHHHSHSY